MISLQELNPNSFPTTLEIDSNLQELCVAINVIRAAYGKPMRVTSGLRSIADHKRIYFEKGIPENQIPMGSKHLFGQACDILDNDGSLHAWCKANEEILKQAGLYLEERQGNWQHFQSVPPRSGNRWFNP